MPPGWRFEAPEGVAVLVVGALVFLILIHRGFRGMVVAIGE